MALAVYDLKGPGQKLSGQRVERPFRFVTDSDYAAGGYALDAEDLGFATIEFVNIGASAGFVPEYDYANSKLKFLYGNYDAADGPLIEVADSLNALDTVEFRGTVTGTV